jgi:hypothetical protein
MRYTWQDGHIYTRSEPMTMLEALDAMDRRCKPEHPGYTHLQYDRQDNFSANRRDGAVTVQLVEVAE